MAVDVARTGDKLAGDELLVEYVQRYQGLVERLCRVMLGDSAEAEDATQQTFLLAYQSLLSGTRPRQPRAWLCTIARRECWARTDRRRRERTVPASAAAAELDPSERVVLRAQLATISEGLGQLPLRQRQAIVLREVAGLSYSQIAAALEVTESAAEALLVRARRSLRRARLVLVLPFPWLRRLFRHGSAVRAPAAALPAKVIAVATLVTVTAAVGGAAMPAERTAQPFRAKTAPTVHKLRASPTAPALIPVPARSHRSKTRVTPKRSVEQSTGGILRPVVTASASAVTPAPAVPDTTARTSTSIPQKHEPATQQPKPAPDRPSRAPGPEPKLKSAPPPPESPAPTPTPAPSDPPATTPVPQEPVAPEAAPADDPGDTQSQSPDVDRGTVNGDTPGANPDPPAAEPDPHGNKPDPHGRR